MPKKRDHGQGALYYLPSRKLWRGVVDLGVDPDTGKRAQKYVHAKTQRACRDKLEAIQGEIREHGAPLDKTTTVAAWGERWLRDIAKPSVDPATYTTYAGSVKWIDRAIGTKRVSAVKPSDITAIKDTIVAGGRSLGTARQAYWVISMMLDAAKAEGLCARNAAQDTKAPVRTPSKRGELTTAQVLAILRAAADMPDAEGARWWFKIVSGLRQGEILGARIADLDLDVGLYEVQYKLEEIARDHGCGAEPCGYKRGAACPRAVWRVPEGFESIHLSGAWHLTRPKSSKGWRVIPLIPPIVEAIRRHLAATADQPNPHGLIWHRPDGSPIIPKDDGQQWRDLLVTAGVIGPDEAAAGGTAITGHWTRHTVVTVLAAAGYDFQLIGEIVGHSSTKVTEMYRHARVEEKRAAMETVGAAWASVLTPQIGA
jgi:integrase